MVYQEKKRILVTKELLNLEEKGKKRYTQNWSQIQRGNKVHAANSEGDQPFDQASKACSWPAWFKTFCLPQEGAEAKDKLLSSVLEQAGETSGQSYTRCQRKRPSGLKSGKQISHLPFLCPVGTQMWSDHRAMVIIFPWYAFCSFCSCTYFSYGKTPGILGGDFLSSRENPI